jgi:hypothetical protein
MIKFLDSNESENKTHQNNKAREGNKMDTNRKGRSHTIPICQ